MAQIGDTVRYLNSVGGGVITKIEGRLAYVEEDGFETPVLLNDLVVVLPAGHEPANKGASLMFDQKAFDEGKKENRSKPVREEAAPKAPEPVELPVEETTHGENLNIVLAFEPQNIKALSSSKINAVLVNDSNYFLSFSLLRRDDEQKAWISVFQGEVAPNELIDLAVYMQENIRELERIVFQAIAYKKGKSFQIKSPINISKKLDLTKFFKVHCFRPGVYFDNPVIEMPLFLGKVQITAQRSKKHLIMKERWWSAPTEGENGGTVIVTGRDYMEEIIEKRKFNYRVTVSWNYNSLPDGMPEDSDAEMMEKATDALMAAFKKDKIAYLTGIYTGDGRRDWVFYTKNLNIFGNVFNRALEPLDTMPLLIEAEEDPEWEEYKEMREISYIPEDDSE